MRDAVRQLVKGQRLNVDLVSRGTGISRASLYRQTPPLDKIDGRMGRTAPNALSPSEREEVLNVLLSEEFAEETPWQVVPKLQDQGQWLCSVSTMYRILRKNKLSKERRHQRRHPKYARPVVEATSSGQVWTWDITRLEGPFKGKHYYLYVMLDLYSRYVVGWMVSANENAEQAQHFIVTCLSKSGVNPETLTIHSDRGSPMTATGTIELLAKLGLSQSFSRPRISNDNPFSEAQFKTLKYHRFFKPWYETIEEAEEVLDKFFQWYNNDHMHSGLGFMTPATVHHGKVEEVKMRRLEAIKAGYHRHPERFSIGAVLPLPPEKVSINLPKSSRRGISYLAGITTLK